MTMLTAEAVAKLQDTLDWITEHPELHDQDNWIKKAAPGATCGTSGCVAGWLTLRNDQIPEDAFTPQYGYNPETMRMDYGTPRYFQIDFDRFDVHLHANQVLGVDYGQNATEEAWRARDLLDTMFQGDRDLPELWALGQVLAEGRLTVPESVSTEGISVDEDGYLINENRDYCSCGCDA
jgi:hypothetical protein